MLDTLQSKKLKGQPIAVEAYDSNEPYFNDTSDDIESVIMDLGTCMYKCKSRARNKVLGRWWILAMLYM